MRALWDGFARRPAPGSNPGAAEQHPFVDAQVLANALEVGDQVQVVLFSRLARGEERPQPRWSKVTMWYRFGSK